MSNAYKRPRGYKTNRERLAIAEQVAILLENCLPSHVRIAAVASCYFTIQGPNSVGIVQGNWALWIRTHLFTDGHPLPTSAWQGSNSGWASGSSIETANSVLECFGLDVNTLMDRYGHPKEGEKYIVHLADAIRDLAPELLTTSKVA